MRSEDKYFETLSEDELWQRYCGFLDLSIDEFMEIQTELLMDEMERLADSTLGKKIMNNQKPKSIEEFRQVVPLTTYDNYEPYLSERQEDALAEKPHVWCHSSGRGGRFKWIPYTSKFLDKITKRCLTTFILSSSTQKGRVNIAPGSRFLIILPPPPYPSGFVYQTLAKQFSFESMPPQDVAENMEFQERIRVGFQMALKDGIDIIASLASVLVRMGEAFEEQTRGMKLSRSMLHPKIIFRLLWAWLRSKREKRPMLPRDLWSVKGIATGGVDTAIYGGNISRYWGSEPCECYGSTEAGILLAIQGWNRKGMVFFPDNVFLEFIPYEEVLRSQEDKNYQPSTVLLSEVEEGKLYEVVITHFYGMPLLRYRMQDIIKFVALRDNEAGVALPHINFEHRMGETIDLGGLTKLYEKTIWQAIVNTGIKYADWSACKEYDHNQSFLRLFLELKEERDAAEVETMIDEQLKIVDIDYRDIGSYLDLQPVRVTLLSSGTFHRYTEERIKEGADLAHLKPAHMNAPESIIQRLLQLS